MRSVLLDARLPGTTATAVLPEVIRFERYPELARHVRSATVHATLPAPAGRSSWELHFRSGLLSWTEEETFDLTALRVTFAQAEGDFDTLTGEWEFAQDGADTTVRFRADFDFGIESLAGILDPIAERVITETIAWVLVGLYPDATLRTRLDLPAVPARG